MNYPRLRGFLPRPVLSILSSIFNAGRAVDQAITTPKHLREVVKTISVGNIATGGNGKTPLVEYLARECIRRKQTPLILSRGYGNDERHQYHWASFSIADQASFASFACKLASFSLKDISSMSFATTVRSRRLARCLAGWLAAVWLISWRVGC